MTHKECPKCGGYIHSGPSFTQGANGEYLRYTCMTCGYTSSSPCKDSHTGPRRPKGLLSL